MLILVFIIYMVLSFLYLHSLFLALTSIVNNILITIDHSPIIVVGVAPITAMIAVSGSTPRANVTAVVTSGSRTEIIQFFLQKQDFGSFWNFWLGFWWWRGMVTFLVFLWGLMWWWGFMTCDRITATHVTFNFLGDILCLSFSFSLCNGIRALDFRYIKIQGSLLIRLNFSAILFLDETRFSN